MATVSTTTQGAVLVVSIDRPEVKNAVDGPTAKALAEAFEWFNDSDEFSVAVLTGGGGTFCAGADLKALASGDPARANRVAPDGDGPMGPTRSILLKPVIAAIEGYAVAGGLELALWCDLRVAAEDAVLGFFDRRWGVPLIDGGTIRLPRLIGHARALDLLLTGRGVPAPEALDMGLVTRVVSSGTALQAAVDLAADIARFPQACLRTDRMSSYQQWDLDVGKAFQNELRLGMKAIQSGETERGAARFASGKGRHGDFEEI